MRLVTRGSLLLVFSLYCLLFVTAQGEELIDVLKVTNVPFPKSSGYAAIATISNEKEVAEFTICYRYLVESYNPNWGTVVHSGRYIDWLGFETGHEKFGYQAKGFPFKRNVLGGGIDGRARPSILTLNLPRTLQTGEWYNFCFAYSSILQKMHAFGNGLKITEHEYADESDLPLPADTFDKMKLLSNVRGLFTDLNVYSEFFEEEQMVTWTTGCNHNDGDIYKWDTNQLNLTHSQSFISSVVQKNKNEICIVSKQTIQSPSKLASQSESRIFKPKIPVNSSYIDQVLEWISETECLLVLFARMGAIDSVAIWQLFHNLKKRLILC